MEWWESDYWSTAGVDELHHKIQAEPGWVYEKYLPGGHLPLHYAAENQASSEVVAALLEAYPEAAREKDDDGYLPLHYAAQNQASSEMVAALLEDHTSAAQ
eukprot:COSAG02_NODE_23375_length_720_cov_3.710145_1_plen_100_part_01